MGQSTWANRDEALYDGACLALAGGMGDGGCSSHRLLRERSARLNIDRVHDDGRMIAPPYVRLPVATGSSESLGSVSPSPELCGLRIAVDRHGVLELAANSAL